MILNLGNQNKDVAKLLKAKTWIIMKLTILLLLFFTLQVYAKTNAQRITIVKNNIHLSEVFKAIEQQTGFHFFYDKNIIQNTAPIDVALKDATIEQALLTCLKGQHLTYSIINNTIVISLEKKTTYFQAQATLTPIEATELPPIEIHGKVRDEDGNPLVNATVIIKGTDKGVTTNNSGDFTINVPDNKTMLIISFTGYQSQQIRVGSQTRIDVKLVRTNSSLNEVIVTALGIKREKRTLGFSAQALSGNDLNEAKETNMINSLEGKIAGLTITENVTGPGSSSKVILRGNRSIFGYNQPLYVIDGVPMDNTSQALGDGGTHGGRDDGDGIGMLNSDNIETITVLKGAAAAALYGSQGENGAIIITTKRAKVGKISVNYTGNYSIDQANILPKIQTEYGQGAGGIFSPSSETSWGPKMAGQEVTLWNGNTVPMEGQPNRLKDFFRTANTVTNTVSVSGGSEKTRTFFSYGNTNAQGILRTHDLNRNNVDLKIDNTITSKLSFTTKLTYIVENDNNPPYTGERDDAVGSIYYAPVSIPLSQMQNYEYTDSLGNLRQNYWLPGSIYQSNPYWKMNRQLYNRLKHRLLGLVQATYKFTDWMSLQVRASEDKTDENTTEKGYNDSYDLSGFGNVYNLYAGNRTATNVDGLLSFKRSLTKAFSLTGYLGASIQQTKYSSVGTVANGLNKLDYFFMVNAKNPITTNNYGQTPQIQSLYGTATLAYKNYLYLDLTARNDWSSALPKANQSYFYPSIGLTAIVSDMVKLPSWISFGKVRFTWAKAGYGGEEYLTRDYFTVSAGGTINTPSLRSLGNYKPELTSSYEGGLDWRFFADRLGVNFTYYQSQTRNQLISLSIPNATLFSAEYINAGLIQNNGVEFTLTGTPVRSNKFSWDILVNYADNVNKVIELSPTLNTAVLDDDRQVLETVEVGKSYGSMYMASWAKDAKGRRLVSATGVPIINALAQTAANYAGNYNPKYTMGLSNSFSYNNLSFSFLIDYKNGGTVIGGTQAALDNDGNSKNSLYGRVNGIVLDAVTSDGTQNTERISSETYFESLGDRTPIKDFYAYSATNLRLREVVLSYNLPDQFVKKSKFIQKAKLSLVGRNLFFFYRDAPYDPEIATATTNIGGLEYSSLPTTRNIGLNLKLSF